MTVNHRARSHVSWVALWILSVEKIAFKTCISSSNVFRMIQGERIPCKYRTDPFAMRKIPRQVMPMPIYKVIEDRYVICSTGRITYIWTRNLGFQETHPMVLVSIVCSVCWPEITLCKVRPPLIWFVCESVTAPSCVILCVWTCRWFGSRRSSIKRAVSISM